NSRKKNVPRRGAVSGFTMKATRTTAGGDLLQSHQPLADHRWLVHGKARDIAARTCKARDIAVLNRSRGADEHDGNCLGLPKERRELCSSIGKDHIWLETHELGRVRVRALHVAATPANVDVDVAVLGPAMLLQNLPECCDASLPVGIALGSVYQHADPP